MKAFSPVPSLFTCFVAITCIPSSHGFSLNGVWNNVKQILLLGTSNQENVAGARPSMAVDDHFGILWGMPDSEAIVGHLFKLPIPSNALKGDVHHYHFRINEAGSTTLPQWLYFNSSSYTFYGLPTPTDQGMVYIEISVQSEHISLNAEPATMSFFIRVHMPNRAYLSHNLKPVQENTEHMQQSKTARCPWDENSNEATLVLDTIMPEITALERITLLYKAANFLGHNVNDISLMPKRNSVVAKLLDQQILVAGPGNVGLSTTNVGVELSWAVGCGEFKQANDITRVMEHNIKNNLITTELGYKIIGWHVSQTQPPENIRKLRKRRQAAAATPTPTVFSSLPTRLTDMSTYTVIASAETTIMEPSPSAPEQTVSSTMSSTMAVQPTLTTGRKSSLLTEVPSISTSMQSLSRDSVSDVLTSAFSEIPMASSIHTGPSVVPNTAPVILNPVDKIQSILGTYFEFRIPEDTFFDKEDGNTRKLNLTMYFANGSSLVPQSWVQFISKSQTVYGLPLTKDITPLPLEFYIVAEDTGGLKARDAFQILIDVESVNDISYQFVMHFTQDFSTFMLATRNYIEVVSKMGAYYGDANSTLTTVTDISSGSVVMSVTNNTISKVACENETILDLYRRMNSSGQLNLAFVRAMVPFAVEQVHLEWLGVCLLEPANATVGPTSIPVIGGGTSTGVIIAVILVILVILIIFIILVCIFCRRRKQKGRYLPEDEKPIYGKNRKPVLLEDELELRDKNMRPKRPVVLSKDNDPNTYANEGFSPAEEGLRQAPPSYIVPYDGGYGPTFDALDGPSSPPVYLPSPAATSSPFDQPPPEYKLPPPYLMYPGHSKA